jgi:hypothetical protein
MRRSLARSVLLCALAVLAGACGSSSSPTNPTPVTVTDTFTGTLNQNAAVVHTYTTSTAGAVTATLTAVGPDATKTIGFAIGSYNTTTNTCQVIIDNPQSLVGQQHAGSVTSQGTYCVRIYDSGSVTADTPFTYTVAVQHPQ